MVDDESINLQVVANFLAPHYEVLTAADGQAALDLIQNRSGSDSIQCIIADQRMPRLTGVEFLKRSIPILPKAIRIILSAYTDVEVILEATNEAHIYQYLTKPIDPRKLLITIQRALETYELEQQQERTLEELRRANQLKDEFLTNTSHELKTPLHGIIGICEAMKEPQVPALSEAQQDNLTLIIQSARRLTTLVNDILDLAQIRSQGISLNWSRIALAAAFQFAERLCAPLLKTKPVRLLLDLPNPPVYVMADENRLQQILVNLLTNAIKFTHEGTIHLGASYAKNFVQIWVQDTGIGISEDQQQRIFQPFVQADGNIARQYGGTGLGLAISRYLIEQHGGSLSLESQEGRGSIFKFTLPEGNPSSEILNVNLLEEDTPLPAPSVPNGEGVMKPHSDESDLTQRRFHLLVVDDDPLNVKVLQDQLSQNGYHVAVAADGMQALATIEAQNHQNALPDLVLLDVMMPLMDGYSVCQKIRERYSPLELPVIILTVKNQMADLEQAFHSGANDYLTKPFHKRELLVRVDNVLQQKQTALLMQENEKLLSEIERFRHLEAHLRDNENYLTVMLESTQEALLLVQSNGTILFVNPSAERLLHYGPDELQNHPLSMLFPKQEEFPNHWLSLPVNQWASGEIQNKAPVTWRCGNGESVSGTIQGALLELEVDLFVFLLTPQSAMLPSGPTTEISPLAQILDKINTQRQELSSSIRSLDHLQSHAVHSASLPNAFPTPAPVSFAQKLVDVMNQVIEYWEANSQKTVIDLAEESQLWSITVDEGRLRARTIEKYLDVNKLPKKPRWRTVVQAAYYVLRRYPAPTRFKLQLESDLASLLAMVRQQKIQSH